MSDSLSPATSHNPPAPGLEAELDQLLATLRGGISNLDPQIAVGIVDRFRTALAGAADPALAGIASELESFRTLLNGNHAGSEIAEALTTLAGKVTALGNQGGPAAAKLTQLGGLLSWGAGQVARAD
jgi:hypothetical protein